MSVVLFSFVVLLITFVTWRFIKNKRRNELLEKIPSPKQLPLIKHAGYFINKKPEEILEKFTEFANDLGSVFYVQIPGSTPQVFVYDPKILEVFLTSQSLISKSKEYELLHQWMGTGLLTASTGQKWFQRRKIITPAFHFSILEQFVEVMEKQGEIFVEKLLKLQGQDIDVFPHVSLYALDVICETAMGYDLKAQLESQSTYVKAVYDMTQILFIRFFDVIKRNEFTYQFTDMYKREKEAIETLHKFTSKVIAERIKLHNLDQNENFIGGTKRKLAFLDLLLQAKADGKPIDDEGIREEVDTFMFEGHDTTTSGIAFALLNLAKYPEFQQQIFEECRDVCGDKKSLTVQDLNQLSFLENFIKESLRLYPSVPFIGRHTNGEVKAGDFIFPEGVALLMAPLFLGRCEKVYKDPLKFDPYRFVEENDKNPFAYIPFSAGQRNCIGQKFAMLEMKSVLSKIVRNFEITVKKENEDPTLIAQLVLRTKEGVILNFSKRN